jgi:hypothetical protein
VGPTQPPILWVPGALSLRIKRSGREVDQSPPSSTEVRMSGAIPPLPQYAFMAWCSVYKSTGTTLHLPFTFMRLMLYGYSPHSWDIMFLWQIFMMCTWRNTLHISKSSVLKLMLACCGIRSLQSTLLSHYVAISVVVAVGTGSVSPGGEDVWILKLADHSPSTSETWEFAERPRVAKCTEVHFPFTFVFVISF